MGTTNTQPTSYASLLEYENFQIGFDSNKGMIKNPNDLGCNSTIITNLRLINQESTADCLTITSIPIDKVTSTEIIKVSKSKSKLFRSILLMSAGIIVGSTTWLLLDVIAITLIFGGLPTLVGFYLLTGWAMPDTDNMLRFNASEQSFDQLLHSYAAQSTANEFLTLFYNGYFKDNTSENNSDSTDSSQIIYSSSSSTFGGSGAANPLENAILVNLSQPEQNYEENPEIQNS